MVCKHCRKTIITDRQREILQLIQEGLSNKHIARKLHITESTVKFHVSAILQLLGARNRTQAAMISIEQEYSS